MLMARLLMGAKRLLRGSISFDGKRKTGVTGVTERDTKCHSPGLVCCDARLFDTNSTGRNSVDGPR
jgi:hypothetical protein